MRCINLRRPYRLEKAEHDVDESLKLRDAMIRESGGRFYRLQYHVCEDRFYPVILHYLSAEDAAAPNSKHLWRRVTEDLPQIRRPQLELGRRMYEWPDRHARLLERRGERRRESGIIK